jgi:signal transduction histidine kinase/DNA-binding response OmpR family regulator/HAMP domain-containing protein
VRGIAKVVTGVANGDLKQKLTLEAKGEIAALADTINGMIDTLATFADQVTTVAREVGVEGKLGGQASVPGAAGTWKALTDNVNQLAANLTTQVRAIAEVATAVTKGDLTRSIRVDARGEVAVLKDNINEMIRNLRDTTQKNSEQDWLKTNLARFTRMLQGQRDLLAVSRLILSELAPLVSAQQGVFFIMNGQGDDALLNLLASYGYREDKHQNGAAQSATALQGSGSGRQVPTTFRLGESLVGQVALEKQNLLLSNIPGDYLRINSALGDAPPASIIILPVLFEGQVKAVIELASFQEFSATHEAFLSQLTESIGIVLHTIEANMRTEELLKQSQSLARELQSRQEELQKTNAELEEKASLLAQQNAEVERKNREVEQAKHALEEKATQLALTSKYKSEFLANMSHELRTPLNSLLILAHQLSENADGNLSSRQVHFAKTIHSAGSDLMALINDILDLSKIESGTVSVEFDEVLFSDLREYVDRTFRHVAEDRSLAFEIETAPDLPAMLSTDSKRLRQVLKNLLSNAFKFTERGRVSLKVSQATRGWSPDHPVLSQARRVIAFSVSDTGIGIPGDKQRLIFEAFQQADGTTSRKFGGTGLGLSISREIARLLGGEIKLQSTVGDGSTFTLYLPDEHPTMTARARAPGQRAALDTDGIRADLIAAALTPTPRPAHLIIDDAESLQPSDTVVLVVENEPAFAEILVDVAHRVGLKAVVATRGETALAEARSIRPAAITLDLRLPDMSGVQVLETLKRDDQLRHIPVHIISGVSDGQEHVLALGAASYWLKPVDIPSLESLLLRIVQRPQRRLVLIGASQQQRTELQTLLEPKGFTLAAAADAADALALISQGADCIVVADDPSQDLSGLLSAIDSQNQTATPAVVLLSGRPVGRRRERLLKQSAGKLILRTASDTEQLGRELEMLLPVAWTGIAQSTPRPSQDQDLSLLVGKRVLVVDDDVRNIFALTSLLERYGLEMLAAENGRAAIATLQSTPGIDIVLMDIMMPEMDGYDTIRAIRNIARFGDLPIIALTARAMKGDRDKCIDAGASDYIPKPVAPDQLLSRLCHWLSREEAPAGQGALHA